MSNIIIQNKFKPPISKLLNFQDMIDARIITKNLVYIIGLSPKIANRELLMKYEYLSQFGKILKIVVNKNKAYNSNNPKGPSYSAYVTFSKPSEASISILSLDSCVVDDHMVRASFGTTKYCTFYLKHQECPNRDCLFLHSVAEESDIISRDDLNYNKNIFMDQQVYAMKIADIFDPDVKKKIISSINKKIKTIFPSPDKLYLKDIVKKNEVHLTPLQIQIAIQSNTTQINPYLVTGNNNLNNDRIRKSNSSTKRRSFEEDMQTITTPVKNKKHNSKYQYIEKTITSNSDLFINYLKIEEEIDKSKYDITILNKNINNLENDINSNESTSICSKDENNSLKLNNINNEVKKEEKENIISSDYIDIIKFNSNKSNLINKLYSRRESSRFEFVNKEIYKNNEINKDLNTITNTNEINVPDFVYEIIKKKVSRHKFTKNINFDEDILYKESILVKELNDSNSWAEYIFENKNIDLEKDLIFDFEIINRSIKDKFTTFYLK